jgi:hypothetical protein
VNDDTGHCPCQPGKFWQTSHHSIVVKSGFWR